MIKDYYIKFHKGNWGLFQEINFETGEYVYWKVPLEGTGTFQNPIEVLEKANEVYPDVWIDCIIDGHNGHLMKIEDWLEDCESGGFIDYDGWGDLLDADGKLLNITMAPSRRSKLPEEAKHILWYNR